MRTLAIGTIFLLAILGGCSDESAVVPAPADPGAVDTGPTDEQIMEQTVESADVVLLAIKSFAADHDGLFSDCANDLIPYLPGGTLIVNAVTGMPTEPQFSAAACTPGQIGCMSILDRRGVAVGCTVSAMGTSEDQYLYVTYIPNGVDQTGTVE